MGIGKTIGMIGGGVGGFFVGGPAGAALGAAGGGALGDALDSSGDDRYQPSGRIARDAPRYGGYGAGAEADRIVGVGQANAELARQAGRDMNVGANAGIASSNIARDAAQRRAAGLYGGATDMYGRAEGNAADAAAARGSAMDSVGRLRSFYERGPGPSAAEAQLRAGQDANERNAMSIARTGGGSPSAVRAALRAGASGGAQTNQSASMLRANEESNWRNTQLNAMGAEQGALQSIRAGDVGVMGQRYGAAGQLLGAGAQSENTALGYGGLGAQYQGMYQQGRLGAENLAQQASGAGESGRANILGNQLTADTSRYQADRGLAGNVVQAQQRDRAADMNMYGSLIGSGVQAMSDVRAKENIRPVSAASLVERVDRMSRPEDVAGAAGTGAMHGGATNLRPAGSYSYDYKSPEYGPDNQVGPMAQELAHSAASGAVTGGANGMMSVDPARLTMTNTSAIGEQQRRLDALEAMVADKAGADWQPKGAATQGQRTIRKTEAIEKRRMSPAERRAMATFGNIGSIKPQDEEFINNYGGRP